MTVVNEDIASPAKNRGRKTKLRWSNLEKVNLMIACPAGRLCLERKGVRRGVDNSVSIMEISRLTQDLTEYFDCGLLEMAAVNWTDVLSSVVVV